MPEGTPKPPTRKAESAGDIKKFYIKGEEAPQIWFEGNVVQPVREKVDIDILLQGLPCSEVSFSKSLGLRPDRGYVLMPKSALGLPRPDFVVSGEAVAVGPGWVDLKGEGPRTGLPPEDESKKKVEGKGFSIVGNLELHSPYGGIKLGPLFVDYDGVVETQDTEDRIGNPAPFGPAVKAGKVPPDSTDSILKYNLTDERIHWVKRGLVTGRYNIESAIEALSIKVGDQLYEKNTVNLVEKRPWNLLELIQVAVANLPPREYTIDGNRIVNPQPRVVQFYPKLILQEHPTNVLWKGITARAALEKLLNDYGLQLNLRYDGNIDVFYTDMAGAYDATKELADLIGNDNHGKAYAFKPPAAMVIGKPIIIEYIETEWEPVCQWDGSTDDYPDSAIIPLEEVISKWDLSHEQLVDGLVAWFDGKDGKAFSSLSGPFGERRRKILKEQAYQWFRSKNWTQFVPIEDKRIKRVKGLFQKVPQDIQASWFEAKKEKDPAKGLWANIVWGNAVDYLQAVDRDNLILKFKQPMGVLVTDPKRIKDEELQKIAAQVLKETKLELAFVTDLQKLISGLGGENLEERKKAEEELRKHAALLKEDISRVNLHECDILPPILQLTFQYKKKYRADVFANAQLVKALQQGQPIAAQPWSIAQKYSDRYTFFVGSPFGHAPEVIPSDIQFIFASDWNNKADCDKLAVSLIQKRYAPPDFVDLEDVEFAGFHPVPTSGRITQVSWDSDAEVATTKVKYGDYIHGIDNRPGINWKEERTGPVTRARWYGAQGEVLD